MNKIIVFLAFTILCSCSNTAEVRENERWYEKDSLLIKETFSDDGRIMRKQTFTQDTIPINAETRYHPNGNIRMWRHYMRFPVVDSPKFIVTYDTNEQYKKMYGNPFKQLIANIDDYYYVTLVKPPKINSAIILQIFHGEKCVRQLKYNMLYNDSIGYVMLDKNKELLFKDGYRYIAKYAVFDSSGTLLDFAKDAMQIELDKYMFIPPPDVEKIEPE
jgi:hypothetical protein